MNTADTTYGATPKRFQMPLCDRTVTTELSNDYTLPDYQPEIRRILRVGTTVIPPAKYIGGSNAEFNGNIDYNLLYVGADGALYSAPLSAEYAFSAPLELSNEFDLNEGVIVLCDSMDESVTVRVSAPRKLSIKCRLVSRVRAYGMMLSEERCVGECNPMSIERFMGECQVNKTLAALGETIECSDEIALSDDELRVISATADANISELSPSEGYLNCRGEATLKMIICRDNDPSTAETMIKKFPFSEQLEFDDLTPDAACRGTAYVSDISISVEDGRILCNLSIIPELTAHIQRPMSYTRDLYSTEKHCESAYREYILPRVCCISGANFSQSERIPLSDTTIKQGSRIVDLWCKPYAEKAELERNKYCISGQCKYTFLLENEGDYSTAELMIPLRYEFEGSASVPESFMADIGVISCRARIDGGNVGIDTELSVCADIYGSERITALSDVRFGDNVERGDGDIVICFPSPDDTAWSVSKKYFVPVSKISGVSSPDDSLSGYVVINK